MVPTNLTGSLKSAKNRFVASITLLLFVLPFGSNLLTNIVLFGVLINSLISLQWADWKSAFRNPIFLLSAAYYGYNLVSLAWSADPENGLRNLETKFSFFASPLVLAANYKFFDFDSRQKWLKTFVFGCVSVLVVALLFAAYRAVNLPPATSGISFLFAYEELSRPFMHPGYLSTYMGIAILICIYFLIGKSESPKWKWSAALVMLFIGMFLLQGRINILALFAVLGLGSSIAAIKMRAYKWLLLPLVPLAAFSGLILFGSDAVKARYLQFPDFSYDISGEAETFNSATFRLAEWKCAKDVIAEYPLIGVGIGANNKALYDSYEKNKFWQGVDNKYNAHNQFLETMLSGGIIGLAFLLILLGGYASMMIKNKDYLLLSALAFFVLSMFTESMLERAWAVILYAVFFPLFLLSESKGAINSNE